MTIQCCPECDFKGEVRLIQYTDLDGTKVREWICPDEDCQAINPIEDLTP